MKKLILVLALLLVTSSAVLGGEALIKSFGEVTPSVGALYTQDDGGDMKFTCTSTVVATEEEETVLLTAGHCATKNQEYLVTFDGATFTRAAIWKLPPDKKDFKYERKFNEPKVDMAFFKIIGSVEVREIELGKNVPMAMGQDVVTSGFPLGVTKVGYVGTIAGIYTRPGDWKGYLMLQIFGAPGSSGSAIVDVTSNKIVGVMVAGKQGRAGLPVIFATPIRYMKYLVLLDAPEEEDE